MAFEWWNRLYSSLYAGYQAARAVFTKEALRSFPAISTSCDHSDDYGLWDYRQTRYELWWGLYENTAYDAVIHAWAVQYKTDYGLGRSIRGVYNPAYRLIEFWATHIWGGSIDPAAGDGKITPSALPIETTNDAVRTPIARIFRDSQWQVNKTILCRLGAALGDVAIKVYDDPDEKRVCLEVVHPASLPWISKDSRGNVRGYQFEERRENPDFDRMRPADEVNKEFCVYTEWCFRKGDTIEFYTLRDGKPYAWPGSPGAAWTTDYPFVPMVFIQHIKVDPNSIFGLSELSAGHVKINEVSDMASHQHDQIRKTVRGAWLVTGVQPPKDGSNPFLPARSRTTANPSPDNTDVPVLYGGSGATAQSLVNSLQLQETSQEIQNQLRELEIDYPELYYLRAVVSGDASAIARREARKPAEAKVVERRGVYDDALCRVLKMAIAIGGQKKYPEYEGFDYGSYARNELDFRIGARPVFNVDVLDKLEIDRLYWTNASIAKGADYPLRQWLLDQGYTKEQIASYDAEIRRLTDQGLDQQERLAEIQAKAKAEAMLQAQEQRMLGGGVEQSPVEANGVAA